jgi:hypothetical protein
MNNQETIQVQVTDDYVSELKNVHMVVPKFDTETRKKE